MQRYKLSNYENAEDAHLSVGKLSEAYDAEDEDCNKSPDLFAGQEPIAEAWRTAYRSMKDSVKPLADLNVEGLSLDPVVKSGFQMVQQEAIRFMTGCDPQTVLTIEPSLLEEKGSDFEQTMRIKKEDSLSLFPKANYVQLEQEIVPSSSSALPSTLHIRAKPWPAVDLSLLGSPSGL